MDEEISLPTLTAAWARRWPNSRPIAHELSCGANGRWVRFHSLPESKRYAGNETEYAEVLRRHNILLGELVGTPAQEQAVLVFTCSWSDGPMPVPRAPDLTAASPPSTYWTSVLEDRDEDTGEEWWTHLYVGQVPWTDGVLDALLRLVADDETAGVIIGCRQLSWLYHPYDGGADVLAASPAQRDQLRDRHKAWLPAHPRGL